MLKKIFPLVLKIAFYPLVFRKIILLPSIKRGYFTALVYKENVLPSSVEKDFFIPHYLKTLFYLLRVKKNVPPNVKKRYFTH